MDVRFSSGSDSLKKELVLCDAEAVRDSDSSSRWPKAFAARHPDRAVEPRDARGKTRKPIPQRYVVSA